MLLCSGLVVGLAVYGEHGYNRQAVRDQFRSSTFKRVAQLLGDEPEDPPLSWMDVIVNALGGVVIAGPGVVLAQWYRGRRTVLSRGEQLWFAQALLVGFMLAFSASAFVWLTLYLMPLNLALLVAAGKWLRWRASSEQEAPVAWSDHFGAGLAFGVAAFLCVYVVVGS